jgi:hypothetical protein
MRLGALLALSLLVALAPPASAAASRTAHVSVTSLSPVVVRGTNFLPNERVTVTVFAKGTRTKTVSANLPGGFRATFHTLSIGTCQAYAVRAKGNRGSTAFLKVIPECAPEGPDALFPIDPIPKHR